MRDDVGIVPYGKKQVCFAVNDIGYRGFLSLRLFQREALMTTY